MTTRMDSGETITENRNRIGAKMGRNSESGVAVAHGDHADANANNGAKTEVGQSSEVTPVPAKPARRPLVLAIVGTVTAVVIGAGVAYYIYSLSYESTDDAFIEGHIIPVSSRVAGHVAKVYVDDNQWVKKGDLLAELDPRDFETRLAAANAGFLAAQAGHKSRSIGADVTEITSDAGVQAATAALATSKSQRTEAQAQASTAQAVLKQTRADLLAVEARHLRATTYLHRIKSLVPQHAAAQDTLDEAVAAEQVATADVSAMKQKIAAQEAAVKQAEAAVAAAESGVHQAEAQLAATKSAPKQVAQSRSQTDVAGADATRAQAEVDQAKLNLSYTKIYAPTSGHVTRKSVEPGAYVQIGQPLLALVDPEVWVIANFKETQLAKMQPGQPVTVTVDTHPGVEFRAHVDSLQYGSGARFSLLPPENATGNYVKVVQRVPVKIVFNDFKEIEHYNLGPGISVTPTVKVSVPGHPTAASKEPSLSR